MLFAQVHTVHVCSVHEYLHGAEMMKNYLGSSSAHAGPIALCPVGVPAPRYFTDDL